MQAEAAIFTNVVDGFACTPTRIEGQIPHALNGCFLRNGPGQQLIGPDRLHLLDGHSFVVAARFESSQVNITGKHTETETHQAERGASQQLRYVFTNRPGGALANVLRVSFANSAAHDVYGFGGKLYASDVFGHYALDPKTLDTVGVSPLNALLTKTNDQISPMPRVHPGGNRLTAYQFRPGVFGNDTITLFEMDADGTLSSTRQHNLEGKGQAVHDVAFTESHDVVIRWGQLAVGPMLLGRATLGESITLPSGEALIYLLPRASSEKRVVARLPQQQMFHLFNAFRRGDDVMIDAVAYDDGIDFGRVHLERYQAGVERQPQVRRHCVNLTSGKVTTRTYAAHGEAPDVDARKHGQASRYGYVAGVNTSASSPVVRGGYFWSNAVLKIDFESGDVTRWQAPAGAFLSPPAFVPNGPGEDEGFLLTWLSDGTQSAVVVLRADDLASGPVATAWFSQPLPATSHTSWYGN